RRGNLDVAEDGLFNDILVVGANEEPNIDFIPERNVGYLLGDERLAEPGDRHYVVRSLSLELDDIGRLDQESGLLCSGPRRPTELKRGETVAMDHRRGMG